MRLKNIILASFVLLVVMSFGTVFAPKNTSAQVSTSSHCTFGSGNLEVGVINEEVRCLQKFLNENGFKIAEAGVGSPGQETTMFGELTKGAVMRWQNANGITSTGIFGPLSQEKYLKSIAALLTSQLSAASTGFAPGSGVPVPAGTVGNSGNNQPPAAQGNEEQEEARDAVLEARDAIEKAEDDVEDADADEIDVEDANDDIADAKDDLLDALYAFVEEDYSEAKNKAEDVIDSMGDILDELHGDDSDAEEAIDDARAAIEDADEQIDEAYDDDEEVDAARNLLEDAEDKLDDAEEAFDDEDFDEAEDLANEAEDLADDAVDAIGN